MDSEARCRILLVEDEASVRRLVARMLRVSGFEVEECQDGWAALARAREDTFDVVLTDSHMPKMAGPELITLLRSRNPTLPIIRMSGSSPEAEQDQELPADVPTLFKPFQLEHLIDTVNRVRAGSRRVESGDLRAGQAP